MITGYPIVFEAEDSGEVSAYVPGLPVYAAADTADEAEDAVRELLALYVEDRQARGLALTRPAARRPYGRASPASRSSAETTRTRSSRRTTW
jgi:predicted RNase H-like HicB family nuclease